MITEERKSAILLGMVDCNCNDCIHFERDIEKTKRLNTNEKIIAYKIHYGRCAKLNKEVGEIANICLLHTQECFKHRRAELLKQ